MKRRVFLSWSGIRSKTVAENLHEFLPLFLPNIEPWISSENIDKGAVWIADIFENLKHSELCIVCVTPENTGAPWLMFEAGAAAINMERSKIFPLLLGMNANALAGPLSLFQLTTLERADFFRMLQSMNNFLGEDGNSEKVLKTHFENSWKKFEQKVKKVEQIKITGSRMNIESVTASLAHLGLPEPELGSHVHFSSGFESFKAYSIVTDLAKERLWIWGRKNRKLFDKEYRDFLEELPNRIASGLDFKLLFLNPDADQTILTKAHKDTGFISDLRQIINRIGDQLSSVGIELHEVARFYNGIRQTGVVIVDDAVMYSPINFDKAGFVEEITNTPFNIVGAESQAGQNIVSAFDSCWRDGIPANYDNKRIE